MIVNGRVAEWLMAPVLKTGKLTLRRFESCPFRQKRGTVAQLVRA